MRPALYLAVVPIVLLTASPNTASAAGLKTKPGRAIVPALVGTWKGPNPQQNAEITVALRKDGHYTMTTRAEQGTRREAGIWWGDKKRVHRQTTSPQKEEPATYTYQVTGGKTLLITAGDGSRVRLQRTGK